MPDMSLFCCHNAKCEHFGKRNFNNINIYCWYGRNKQKRLLKCSSCKIRFSEHRGTPYFNSRLPKEEVTNIMAHLREGNGIRRTGRLTKHSKDTVLRYSTLAGQHALNLHDELVAISP